MQKKIKLIKNLSITLYFLNKHKFLVINKENKAFYLSVPNTILCTKENETLILTNLIGLSEKENSVFNFFFQRLSNWLKSFEKPLVKKLILKGLGLKASLISVKVLELKLGLSHVININIPETLLVSIKKNIIHVEGFDSVLLGNFLHQIRILKYPNIYKGKGIWYKNELKTLKIVKKT